MSFSGDAVVLEPMERGQWGRRGRISAILPFFWLDAARRRVASAAANVGQHLHEPDGAWNQSAPPAARSACAFGF